MIYEIDGKRQLIIWHPESVNSLDPATGKVYWSQPYAKKKFDQGGPDRFRRRGWTATASF